MKVSSIFGGIVLAVTISGCGGGGSGGGGETPTYSTTKAENNMGTLGGAMNDIIGLSSWSEAINGVFEEKYTRPDQNTSFEDVVIACSAKGSMKVDGTYVLRKDDDMLDLNFEMDGCEMQGGELAGEIAIKTTVKLIEKDTDWDIRFKRFTIGVGRSGESTTSGTLLQHISVSGNSQSLQLDANTTSKAGEKVRYDGFRVQVDNEDKLKIDGKYEMIESNFNCLKGLYDIQTFSAMKTDSYVPFLPVDGEVGINGISYSFNADGGSEVVDGRTMWTMKVEDYADYKCDD